jgi:hypothetical protein
MTWNLEWNAGGAARISKMKWHCDDFVAQKSPILEILASAYAGAVKA